MTDAENGIHSGHSQATFDKGNVATIKSGEFCELFLAQFYGAPSLGKNLTNEFFECGVCLSQDFRLGILRRFIRILWYEFFLFFRLTLWCGGDVVRGVIHYLIKMIFGVGLLGGLVGVALGEEENEVVYSIVGDIADGRANLAGDQVEVPNFEVIQEWSRRAQTTESPPMLGLPAVQGERRVTVRKVRVPKLPGGAVDDELDKKVSLSDAELEAARKEWEELVAAKAEWAEAYEGTKLIFVSATVYRLADGARTRLRIYPDADASKELVAWSNVDFNHFGGFSIFQINWPDGRRADRGTLLGLGSVEVRGGNRWLSPEGFSLKDIPELADVEVAGPAFVVDEAVTGEPNEMALARLQELHELYRAEGERMKAAYEKRVVADRARRAFLRKHPPKPKDLVLHYWRPQRSETSEKGGAE